MNWLNTPGGHIFVGLLFVIGGQAEEYLGMAYGRELTTAGMTLVLRSMWGAATSKLDKQKEYSHPEMRPPIPKTKPPNF